MPTPVFATAYKVLVKGTLFTVPVENVWYCQGPDPFDTAQATNIAGIFQTAYGSILLELSQDLSISEVEVTNLGGIATGQYIFTITPAMVGGIGVGSLPGSNALCVTLRTALAGRRFRGRKYFSGLPESKVTGNAVDSVTAGNIRTAVDTLMADLAANGTPLSVFSTTGVTLVPCTAITLTDLRVDSQRGRLK